jgi:hypothetical protein
MSAVWSEGEGASADLGRSKGYWSRGFMVKTTRPTMPQEPVPMPTPAAKEPCWTAPLLDFNLSLGVILQARANHEGASRIRRRASSFVLPTATQPGRSGTYAPKLPSPFSRITTNSMLGSLRLETCLLENALERARRHIETGLSCDRHEARFQFMLELPVTSGRSRLPPPVFFDHLDDVSYLHGCPRFYARELTLSNQEVLRLPDA